MEAKICGNCGKEISSNDNYCNFCGASLKNENAEDIEKETVSKMQGFGKSLHKRSKEYLNDKYIYLTDSKNRDSLFNELKLKARENKLKAGIFAAAILLFILFILSPSPTEVATDFIEYSAYDQREKAVPLMSSEGIDYMMGMTKEEFETHPDFADYDTVLRTRISTLTHDVYRQGRELLSYELISKETIDDGVVLNYQLVFDNSDTVVTWIHLTKEFGGWKVFSFQELY